MYVPRAQERKARKVVLSSHNSQTKGDCLGAAKGMLGMSADGIYGCGGQAEAEVSGGGEGGRV